jgi:hypothetical protein
VTQLDCGLMGLRGAAALEQGGDIISLESLVESLESSIKSIFGSGEHRVVSLIGPSRQGKSTVLNLLLCLHMDWWAYQHMAMPPAELQHLMFREGPNQIR